MDWTDILRLCVALVYLAGTLCFLAGSGFQREGLKRWAVGLALGGAALHGLQLALSASAGTGALAAGAFYLSLVALAVLLAALVIWWRLKSRFLALSVLPLSLLLFVAAQAAGGIKVTIPPTFTLLFFGLHIAALVTCLALLAVAFGAGLAFLRLDRKIKTKAGLSSLGNDMPSLNNFDRANGVATLLGFPLYTLGLVSGFLWKWFDPARKFAWDPMNITALGVWFLFLALFYQRAILGWRGRKPANMAILVFVFIVVAFVHHTVTFKS